MRNLYIHNSFPHGRVQGKIRAKLPIYLLSEHYEENSVFKLKRSLHGLKDAALVWHDLFLSRFADPGFHELGKPPCTFKEVSSSLSCMKMI